jgi:hypothetical protein
MTPICQNDVIVDRKLFSFSVNRIQTSSPIIFTSSRQLRFLANASDCMGALQHISFNVSGARE